MVEGEDMRTINEVGKRAKKSIIIQLNKLSKRYGDKVVRLVSLRYFSKKSNELKLQKEIKNREEELNNLRKKL